MVLIPNTLELTTLWVTPPLAGEVEADPRPRLRDRLPARSRSTPTGRSTRRRCSPRASGAGGAAGVTRTLSHDDLPIRAVVFDLDGLMFDTEALFFRVAARDAPRRGARRSRPRSCAAMIGRQRGRVACPAFKAMAGLDESAEDLMAEARARFDAADRHGRPPDARPVRAARPPGDARACRWRSATSSRRAYAERLLGGHGLRDRFAFVLCARGRDAQQARPRDLPDGRRAVRGRAGVGAGPRGQPGGPGRGEGGRGVRRRRPPRAQPGRSA